MANSKKHILKFTYDFAVDSTADLVVPAINEKLPVGAIVTNVISDELTAFTSGGSATVTVQSGAIALTDALAYNTGFTGVDTHALASSAEGIKITASADMKIAVGTAPLTAGKCDFYIEYIF